MAFLVAARPEGGVGPWHAVEAEGLVLDLSTLCGRYGTYDTDAVEAFLTDRRFLAVADGERCATCAYLAGARDAGLPDRVTMVDATPKGRPLGGDRWDLPPLRPQPGAPG